MKETMKKLIEVFLICHFLINLAIGVCGMLLGPDTKLGYGDLFVPSLMAFLCTLPTLLTIQPEKLTVKQIVLRKILQVLMVEAIVLSMIHFGFHGINSIGGAFTVVVSVLLVFAGVSLVDWARGCMEAEDLNRRLAQLQKGT